MLREREGRQRRFSPLLSFRKGNSKEGCLGLRVGETPGRVWECGGGRARACAEPLLILAEQLLALPAGQTSGNSRADGVSVRTYSC